MNGRKPSTRVDIAATDPVVEISNGNVFADLGLPDADELLAKAELAHEICAIIQREGLTPREAAGRMGIDQPKVSAIRHGRLKDFSTDRLVRFLNSLPTDGRGFARIKRGD